MWYAVLLVVDMVCDRSEPRHLNVSALATLFLVASVMFVMTFRKEDLDWIPVLRRLSPFVLARQSAVAKKCGFLKKQALWTWVAFFFAIIASLLRVPTSPASYFWLSLSILSVVASVVNLIVLFFR